MLAAQTEWLEKDYYTVPGVPDTATDKEITKAYRLARQLHPDANPGAGFGGPGNVGERIRVDNHDGVGDLGAIFGDLFGGASRGAWPGRGARRGEDLEAELTLRFDDAMRGVTTHVQLTGPTTCDACHGAGGSAGSQPQQCGQCDGGAGDLLVTVEVVVRARVTGREREAVEALTQAMGPAPRQHLGPV